MPDNDNRFYVYLHRKPSNGDVFYVGKGSGKRAWVVHKRSLKWTSVYSKYGMTVEIVQDNLSEAAAFELEKNTIAKLKAQSLNLCNFTDGGEGSSGYKHSTNSCKIMSDRKKSEYNTEMAGRLADGIRKYYKSHGGVRYFSEKPWMHPNSRTDIWANFKLIYMYHTMGILTSKVFPDVDVRRLVDHIHKGLTPDNPDYLLFKEGLNSEYSLTEFPLKALEHYYNLYTTLPEICTPRCQKFVLSLEVVKGT